MVVSIILIMLGIVTTTALAFTSHDAKSQFQRFLFWGSLLITLGIIVFTGEQGIMQSRKIKGLESNLDAVATGPRMWALCNPDIRNSVLALFRSCGTPKVGIDIKNGTDESWRFANCLKDLMTEAGWQVGMGRSMSGSTVSGVLIAIRTNPPLCQAKTIFDALTKAGIKVQYIIERGDSDMVTVVICPQLEL